MTANINDKSKGISKILIAIDGSTSSLDALDDAIEIARKNNSQLVVIYVIDFYKFPYLLSSTVLSPTFGMEKYMEEKKDAEKLLDSIKEKYKQKTEDKEAKNLRTQVIEGVKSIAATIVEYAESEGIDLIVVGSRGRTGFKKMLIGSVSLDVVKYAHCSVLVKR
ncbi:MAG: universal stress protein [Candidatus Nitrosocosmicus sp.]